jgi:G3E family GTPase
MVEVPVFVINGFLESGKTSLIKDVISSNYEGQVGDTLLVVCEEGELEYEQEFLDKYKVHVKYIHSQDELSKEFFEKCDQELEPARVVIEFNSFFKFDLIDLPSQYVIGQVISLIDASTFNVYFNNMKQIFNEVTKDADLIIFNRCDGVKDLASYRRMIRAFNGNAQIAFEGKDGALSETLAEDLPYDLSKEEIKLKDSEYPTFYMDAFDNYERYYGKEISFLACLQELEGVDDFSRFLPGRRVMTCCANDVRFLGFETVNDINATFKAGDWAFVTVTLNHEFSNITNQEEVILHLKKLVKVDRQDENDILSLV